MPRKLTSFIGREAEVAEITELLGTHQLVTLVGSGGGVGKTRTSLAVAEGVFGAFADGVWFVELAPLSRGDYIPGTVARALGFTLAVDGDPVANVTRAPKSKQLLLVLDNCEHLVADVAQVAAVILSDCHKVKILATAREPLRIRGEATYRVPSLPVPPAADTVSLSVAEALTYVSVALFVERARAVDHRFMLTDEVAPIVADICRRLDGIPLAIELAAARVLLLSPHQLRDRLSERFRILTGGGRDQLQRHQTLRALIDWSHDLLDERERRLFRRLAIFANVFTLEATSAVGGGDGIDASEVFDLLSSLVEKSLVMSDPPGDAMRYRLLESTRAYAAQKLEEASERDVIAVRHLRYLRDIFGQLHAEAERTLRLARGEVTFIAQLDDVRAALDEALMRVDIIAGAELLAAIDRFWVHCALRREAIARIESFAARLPVTETSLRAQLLSIDASLLCEAGMFALSRDVAADAVAAARQSSDGSTLAFGLIHSAWAAIFLDDIAAAQTALDEADARTGVSARLQANLLEARAQLYKRIGDLDSAIPMFEQMRRQWGALQNHRSEAVAATNIAEIEHQRGQTAAAIAIMRDVLPALRQLPDVMMRAGASTALSGFLFAVNDFAAGIEAAREAIDILAPREPDSYYIAYAIEHLALACALRGDLPRAAIFAGYGDAAIARAGTTRDFTAQTTYDRLGTILHEKLAPPDLTRLTAEGAALTTETAVACALTVTLP